ncbi:MAG: sensor histidine kinase, partial [Bacteroidota bacterium]|nr:sensor histidine kinase [Bacteroidota bacterium]
MKTRYKILIHLLFWIYIINQALFPLYIQDIKISSYTEYYYEIIIYIFTGLITFYPIYFLISPVQSIRPKWFAVPVALAILGIIVFVRVGFEYSYWKYLVPSPPEKMIVIEKTWIYNSIRLVIIYTAYSVLIRFSIGWYEAQKLKTELKLQNQACELILLRSQINPHFLFNTLNNIYSLVYKKSDDAPAAVMKLSSIMRYMLYDSNSDTVLLEKEIDYLQSFIELQKLRLRQKDFVEFKMTGSANGKIIAPMLLIPFVENAFKHCSKTVAQPGIFIHLDIKSDRIEFDVKNYIKKSTMIDKDPGKGIGMQNIHRRLELLYPGK